MLQQIILWVLQSPLDEMFFDALKLEFFLEEIYDIVLVNVILACINIRSEKPTPWERMNSNMALGDNHKPAPTGLKTRRRESFHFQWHLSKANTMLILFPRTRNADFAKK
jgi:hypothetical protein